MFFSCLFFFFSCFFFFFVVFFFVVFFFCVFFCSFFCAFLTIQRLGVFVWCECVEGACSCMCGKVCSGYWLC